MTLFIRITSRYTKGEFHYMIKETLVSAARGIVNVLAKLKQAF